MTVTKPTSKREDEGKSERSGRQQDRDVQYNDDETSDEEEDVISVSDDDDCVANKEEDDEVYYDKKRSFFDSISCEALERSKGKNNRPDWRAEKKLNKETFGVATHSGSGYHRGGGRGGRGGFSASPSKAKKTGNIAGFTGTKITF